MKSHEIPMCPPCFSMAEPPKRRPTVEDGEGRADAAEVVIRPGLEGGQHLGGPHEEKNAELHSYWTLPFLMRKITIFNGKYGGIYPLFIGKSSINGIWMGYTLWLCQNSYGKIHHAINGKIHYFYGHGFNSYVKLPEGTPWWVVVESPFWYGKHL